MPCRCDGGGLGLTLVEREWRAPHLYSSDSASVSHGQPRDPPGFVGLNTLLTKRDFKALLAPPRQRKKLNFHDAVPDVRSTRSEIESKSLSPAGHSAGTATPVQGGVVLPAHPPALTSPNSLFQSAGSQCQGLCPPVIRPGPGHQDTAATHTAAALSPFPDSHLSVAGGLFLMHTCLQSHNATSYIFQAIRVVLRIQLK